MYWYLKALKNYTKFRGRASRKEFWTFYLINIIIALALSYLDRVFGLMLNYSFGILQLIYMLFTFLPSVALQSRRLHDIGRSFTWILLIFIPFIGIIILIIFYAMDSERGVNEYGQNPKTGHNMEFVES